MHVVIVTAKVKPEQRGRFLQAIEEHAVSSVRDEPGCLRFDARWREAAEVCLAEPLEATHAAMVITRQDR